jgi:hypothetical protein
MVGQLLEAELVGDSDVVHEAVGRTESAGRLGDELLGRGRLGEVADHAESGAALVSRALDALRIAPADDDARPLVREELGGR